MLDRFVYGHVDRISPEAPIPVLRIDREQAMLVGAGNVVAQPRRPRRRGRVRLRRRARSGRARGDAAWSARWTASSPHLLVDTSRPTTIKTRYIADGHQMLRADRESNAPVGAEAARDVVRTVEHAIADCDVVVLSDYAKGVLERQTRRDAGRRAQGRQAGRHRSEGPSWTRYRGATVLTPNRHELARPPGCRPTNSPIRRPAPMLRALRRRGGAVHARRATGWRWCARAARPHHGVDRAGGVRRLGRRRHGDRHVLRRPRGRPLDGGAIRPSPLRLSFSYS